MAVLGIANKDLAAIFIIKKWRIVMDDNSVLFIEGNDIFNSLEHFKSKTYQNPVLDKSQLISSNSTSS